MKQFFRTIWEFFFGKSIDLDEPCSDENCCEDKDYCKEKIYDKEIKLPLVTSLEEQKAKAISECDGCEDEVFVLRFNNEDVDYARSLNQLIIRNKLPKTSTYAFWNNKQNLSPNDKAGLLANKYDIIKLA